MTMTMSDHDIVIMTMMISMRIIIMMSSFPSLIDNYHDNANDDDWVHEGDDEKRFRARMLVDDSYPFREYLEKRLKINLDKSQQVAENVREPALLFDS